MVNHMEYNERIMKHEVSIYFLIKRIR